MKIVTQVGIIFSICWISQIIEKLLPFSFPASVIGMILLFILLCVHILKVDHIRENRIFCWKIWHSFLSRRSQHHQLF